VRLGLRTFLIFAGAWLTFLSSAQQLSKPESPKPDSAKTEPKYDDTFSGSIIELTTSRITVSRSILGKPAEKRVFLIASDTRIEGKLHVKLKVTIGFVTSDDGDIARLIVVRQKPPDKK
jgi:hypothetical protein